MWNPIDDTLLVNGEWDIYLKELEYVNFFQLTHHPWRDNAISKIFSKSSRYGLMDGGITIANKTIK